MGLLDAYTNPNQSQGGGGLLGGLQQPAPPQGGGALPPMPQELQQAIQQMKGADPETRNQFSQQVLQKIQSMPKPPAMVQQAIQQFMEAMG